MPKPAAKETLNIVALRRVSYSDRRSILTAWSRERGRVSLLIEDGAGRTAARTRALTAPPALLECVADVRPGRDIYPASQLRTSCPLADVRTNPVKGMVAMFLAEVMAAVMPQSQPDARLFDFIATSMQLLDTTDDERVVANFHIWFLLQLGRYLGIEPDSDTWRPGRLLDMRDGSYRTTPPPHSDFLSASDSVVAARLHRMTMRNMARWQMSRTERNNIVDTILRYMALHLSASLTSLRSIEVIRAVL